MFVLFVGQHGLDNSDVVVVLEGLYGAVGRVVVQKEEMLCPQRAVVLHKGVHVRPPVPDEAHHDELVRLVVPLLGPMQVFYAGAQSLLSHYVVSCHKPDPPITALQAIPSLGSPYPFRPSTLARMRPSLFSSLTLLELLMFCSWCVRVRFFFRNLASLLLSLSTSLWLCSLSSLSCRLSLLALRLWAFACALAR